MKQRRINDAQVERLLDGMRRNAGYRSELAHRLVQSEGHKPGSSEYKRRYRSTMRRFQRYVTEAEEKRSFARAPVVYQREVRREARYIPALPPGLPKKIVHKIKPDEFLSDEDDQTDEEEIVTPISDRRPTYDSRRDLSEYDLPTLEQTVRAYHDGDIDEAARELSLSKRATDLLDLATTGEGVEVDNMRGAGELRDALSNFLDRLPRSDLDDIRSFHDLLMNLPDWQIGMILEDLENGFTTFADWMDAYRNDNYDIEDVTESMYWELWRAAYKRIKA